MSQTWTDDVFASDHQGTADLQNIENNLAALKSQFSGASAPSNSVAGMPWYHTSKGLRIRNAGASAWIKTLQGDATSKTFFYRNDTAEGWLVDSSITDRILAIKGGSQAYNVNGGTAAGAWAGISIGNDNVLHQHATPVLSHSVTTAQAAPYQAGDGVGGALDVVVAVNNHIANNTGSQSVYHQHAATPDVNARPAAAVGTLQYPDLS